MSRLPYRAKWVAQIEGTFYSAVKSLSIEEQEYVVSRTSLRRFEFLCI
jgi:hypothetical protein